VTERRRAVAGLSDEIRSLRLGSQRDELVEEQDHLVGALSRMELSAIPEHVAEFIERRERVRKIKISSMRTFGAGSSYATISRP
jgi:hypothetical protein